MVSLCIACVIWYPVYNVIDYKFLPLGLLSFIAIIQYARWFVFFESVFFFKTSYSKVIFVCFLLVSSFIIWSEGQKIVALIENMEVKDIVPEFTTPVFLTYEENYNLFSYLQNLLVISNYGTPGIAFVLCAKIFYRTLRGSKNE